MNKKVLLGIVMVLLFSSLAFAFPKNDSDILVLLEFENASNLGQNFAPNATFSTNAVLQTGGGPFSDNVSYNYDSGSSYIRDDSFTLDTTYTVGFWYRTNASGLNELAVTHQGTGFLNRRFLIYGLNSANIAGTAYSNGGGASSCYTFANSSAGYTNGEWFFVAMVINGTNNAYTRINNYTIDIDNSPSCTQTVTNQRLDVGTRSVDNFGASSGDYDNVFIIDRALTDTELADIYENGFEEAIATTYFDVIVNNKDEFGVVIENSTAATVTGVNNGTGFWKAPNNAYVDQIANVSINGVPYTLPSSCLQFPEVSISRQGFDNDWVCTDEEGVRVYEILAGVTPSITSVSFNFSGDYIGYVATQGNVTTGFKQTDGLRDLTVFATGFANYNENNYNLSSDLIISLFSNETYNNFTFKEEVSGNPFIGTTINVEYPNSDDLPFVTDSNGAISIPAVLDREVQEGSYVFQFPAVPGFQSPINFTDSFTEAQMPFNYTYNLTLLNVTITQTEPPYDEFITDTSIPLNYSADITNPDSTYIDDCTFTDTQGGFIATVSLDSSNTSMTARYEGVDISTYFDADVTWTINCSTDNTTLLPSSSVYIIDTTVPVISLNPTGNNFGLDNMSVLSKQYYDLEYNVSFNDLNLFAARVTIDCNTSGQIYQWNETNITVPKDPVIGVDNGTSWNANNFAIESKQATVQINTQNLTLPSGCLDFPEVGVMRLSVNQYYYCVDGAGLPLIKISPGAIPQAPITDVSYTFAPIYIKSDTVDLSPYPLQSCEISFWAQDDHTDEEIEEYEVFDTNQELVFHTENKIEVLVKSEDYDVEDADEKKEIDRYLFEFEYGEKNLTRIYRIKSDKPLIYRERSSYPAHFVAFDSNTMKGNWIDFDADIETMDYYVERINDYEYVVVVNNTVPEEYVLEPRKKGILSFIGIGEDMTEEEIIIEDFGIDEVTFHSIGDLNEYELNATFQIGGILNVSGLNLYDNGLMVDANVTINGSVGGSPMNYTFALNGSEIIVENISLGYYDYNMTSPIYFPQNDSFFMNNETGYLVISSYQAQLNLSAVDVKTLNNILTMTYNITATNGFQKSVSSGGEAYTILYLNASEYNVTASSPSYVDSNTSFNMSILDSQSYQFTMFFLAEFNIFDEETGLPFDIASADEITFVLICDNSTFFTNVTTNNATIPIECDYEKFTFRVTYGADTYFRTLIVPSTEFQEVDVYLLNLDTTQAVLVKFAVDDLYNQFEDISIYVTSIILNDTVNIHSDFVDFDNSMASFLMQNQQYNLEIHSSNNPVYLPGTYTANFAETKFIRVYQVGAEANPDIETVRNSAAFIEESTNETFIYAFYNDTTNSTSEVTFNIYQDSLAGSLIFTQTVNESVATLVYNATQYENDTLIVQIVDADAWSKTVLADSSIDNNPLDYLDADWLNWLITAILSVFAAYAISQNANLMSVVLIIAAGSLVMFGLYGIGWAVLGLSGVIAVGRLLLRGPGRR